MSQILTHFNKGQLDERKLIELDSDKSLETISYCISQLEKKTKYYHFINLWLQSYKKSSEIPFNFITSSGLIEIISNYILQKKYLDISITDFLICCCSIFQPTLPIVTTFDYKIFIPLIEYCYMSENTSYIFYSSVLLSQILLIDCEITEIVRSSNLHQMIVSFMSFRDSKILIIASQILMVISLEHSDIVIKNLYNIAMNNNLNLSILALKAIILIMDVNKQTIPLFVSNNIYQLLVDLLNTVNAIDSASIVCCVTNIVKRIILSDQINNQHISSIIKILSEKLTLLNDNKNAILSIVDVFTLCTKINDLITFFSTEKLIQTIIEIGVQSSYDISVACSNFFQSLVTKDIICDKYISSILDTFEKVLDGYNESVIINILDTLSFLMNNKGLKDVILNHSIKSQVESILNSNTVSENVSVRCFNILA